jgi:uncharacterized protein (DUF433 family)
MKKYRFITSDPGVLGGMPVIVGTRVPISRILFLLKDGYTLESISEDYPHVGRQKIEMAINELINSLEKDYASGILQV